MSAAMSLEESLNDYRLLELIAILSRRGSSGRLQIDCGSTQGSLCFDKGKIAAARIGSLTGFSAINLAISLQGTRLRFEPLLEVPASEFTDPNERLLLNKLLGIETVIPGFARNLDDSTGSSARAMAAEPLVAPPSLEVTPPAREVTPPALEVTPPLSEGPPPTLEAMPPSSEVPSPTLAVTPPSSEVPSPTLEVTPPLLELPLPSLQVPPPSLEVTLPLLEVTPPSAEATPPSSEATPHSLAVTLPLLEVTPPSAEVTPPSLAVTPPSAEVAPPSAEVTSPSAEVTPPPLEVIPPLLEVTPPLLEVTPLLSEVTPLSQSVGEMIFSALPLRTLRLSGEFFRKLIHRRGAENAEIAQREAYSDRLLSPEVTPPSPEVTPPLSEATLPSSVTELTGKMIDWWKNVGPTAQSLPSFVNQLGHYTTRQKMTVRASSILLIAGLAAVGITAFRSRANRPAPPNMSHDTTVTATSGRNDVPTARRGEDMHTPLTVNTNSIPPGPERSVPETILKNQAIVSSPARAEATSRRKIKAVSREPVKGESFDEAKRPAKLVFKQIPVMVRIEDGHVAEAYIKSRHAGAEGYEATALRVARQRRYPKNTMGVETIIVQVANEH
jgi:hypothetical protein